MLGPTAHIDTFARDNLPPPDMQPEYLLGSFQYPERLNAAVELTDRMVERGFGDHVALIGNGRRRTYKELTDWSNRVAHALVENYGVKPGNRVLIRSANNPAMVACWLAATKAGAVVVNTMPMLRPGELTQIVDQAEIAFALCDTRIMDDLVTCANGNKFLKKVIGFDGTANHDSEMDRIALDKDVRFQAVDTGRDDVALLAFTSGTTGRPKATMHFHRDVLAIADTFSSHVLRPNPDDLFAGTPPLAFTFGLGQSVVFPMRAGAATYLLEKPSPQGLLEAVERYGITVLATAPTAYRAMVPNLKAADLRSLRACVSAGETLPKATWEAVHDASGLRIIDGIGSTEMLHIFISAAGHDIKPGSTGRAVPGYVAEVQDSDGNAVPDGELGRLAVKGPTGCRYLRGDRQTTYVRNGWNITGDVYTRDKDGYFFYQARADDMIISAGYNIAGPEVEEALLRHPAVAEAAVVGAPDEERGMIVKAVVVLQPGAQLGAEPEKTLQDFVKAQIAPYKYPRAIEFADALPRTATGKLQRFRLREGS